MQDERMINYLEAVLANCPSDWLKLTTHRLDIYDEKLAKTQFLEQFEVLYEKNNAGEVSLNELPTAFDYIRLGHPLSCVLEWSIAKSYSISSELVISFSSKTAPILSILRKNLFDNKKTLLAYMGDSPAAFNIDLVRKIYAYEVDLIQVSGIEEIPEFEGSVIFASDQNQLIQGTLSPQVDFYINWYHGLGSTIVVNGAHNASYVSEIQHVRRRETIAMTPANTMSALESLIKTAPLEENKIDIESDKASVAQSIQEIAGLNTKVLVGSSGLSVQYAIMMGLIHNALEQYPGKAIKIVVPPNCYGGTNDQARRVAACIGTVEIVDLPVDGDNDMVESVDRVLEKIAAEDAIPFIIAEIPTNPRVEVPDLAALKAALSKTRKTSQGTLAIEPVFILDQTFCPNVLFLGEGKALSSVQTISYASGSKFPSGGLCTAGYCIANTKAEHLMKKIALHMSLCDNEATALQYEILAKQLPSMNQRIQGAYHNTREFVNFIHEHLPEAKINFVSEELASQDFTPSVFSLDLPTKGNTEEEKETYKRALNLKLINLMISEIPNESKYCVSYGQLKGCYWTIPATSTQGTTKEGDKDYIARVALSDNMDLDLHKKVFLDFVKSI